MAKTVTINGKTGNEYIDVKLVVQHYPDVSHNWSFFSAALYYKRNNSGFTTTGTGTFSISLTCPPGLCGHTSNPSTTTKSVSVTITESAWVKVLEVPLGQVLHADDGTGYADFSATGSIPGTTLTSTTLSGRVVFDTIERASTIDSLSGTDGYFTDTFTYNYTPKYGGFYNQCNISLHLGDNYIPVKSISLGKKEASQQKATVKLSSDELSTVYSNLPTATSGALRFTFRTYSDEYETEVEGGGGWKELTLTIPNDSTTQPTMDWKLSPVHIDGFTPNNTIYVKSLSQVKATFSNGKSPSGATSFTYKLTVSGKDYSSSSASSPSATSDYLATTGSITVKCTIKDSRGYSRTYTQNISVYDYTKPTINSVVCTPKDFDGTITIKYTPANTVFYSICNVAINTGNGYERIRTITLKQATGQQEETFSFEPEELEEIYGYFPNSAKGTLRFTMRTYTDYDGTTYSNQIPDSGAAKDATDLNIPENNATKPTAIFTIEPISSLASVFNGLYIKGKAKVKAILKSGAGKYGASISSYTVSIGAQSETSSSAITLTSPYLAASGDLTITGTVTDTRGFSWKDTREITVIDHSAPRLLPINGQSEIIAARCNSDGALDENGTGLFIAAKISYSSVEGRNKCSLAYRYTQEGTPFTDVNKEDSWTTLLSDDATNDYVAKKVIDVGKLETTATYYVQIRAKDLVGDSTITTISVTTQKVYLHKAGSINSFGIGKYAELPNTVDIAEDFTAIVRGELKALGGFSVGDEAQAASEDGLPSLPVRISDTGWISLGIIETNEAVTASSNDVGRGTTGPGCYYRVINANHVYVAFNCACTYSGSALIINKDKIPTEYCPARNAYAMVPTGGRAIVRAIANHSGNIVIDYVQSMTATANTTSANVSWIDGYIDYWI